MKISCVALSALLIESVGRTLFLSELLAEQATRSRTTPQNGGGDDVEGGKSM